MEGTCSERRRYRPPLWSPDTGGDGGLKTRRRWGGGESVWQQHERTMHSEQTYLNTQQQYDRLMGQVYNNSIEWI